MLTTTAEITPVDTQSYVQRWYVLIVMCLIYTINIADRYVMSTILEPIRLELHLTDSGIAFLTGVSLALFYVTFGIPISWLADRSNRRNILAASLVLWSVMTTLCGLSRNYWQLLTARIGVGVGEAGGTPQSSAIVADYFPPDRRPMALTVLALGIPGALLGLIVYLTIREPTRGRLDAIAEDHKPTLIESCQFLWRQKAAFHVVMGGGVCALWGWGLIWWTPTFLTRTYGLNVAQAGDALGWIHLIGGSIATIGTAWLLSRPPMADPRKVVWVLGMGVGLTTIPSFIAYFTHTLWIAKLMFWLFVPAIYFYIGPCFGLLQNLAPCHMRSMFIAISLLVANIFNLIIAPQAVGFMSDRFAGAHGADAASLRLALLILAPTGFWATYHFYLAGRTIVKDQERAIGYTTASSP